MDTSLLIHRTSVSTGDICRTEILDGREYRVFPVVLIVDNVVMNGLLYPAEELESFAESWNGIPIPLYHPEDEAGDFLSANIPAVLEKWTMGRLFNVVHEGGRLKGEMWIDVAKCQVNEPMQAALDRLESGMPTEVSTGLYCEVELTNGRMNGVPYDGIARNIHPDHLALLPEQEGACNWKDGCGVPRVNAKEPVNYQTCHCGLPVINQHTGIMIALYPPADIARRLALDPADLPPGATAVPAEEIHLTLTYLGKVDGTDLEQDTLIASLSDFANHAPVVWGEIHGTGRFNNDEEHAFYATFNSDYLTRFRTALAGRTATPFRDAFIPHITLAYLPPDAPTPGVMPEKEVIAFKNLALAWGGQVTMFSLQGSERDTAVNTLQQILSVNRDAQNNDDKEVPMSDEQVAAIPEEELEEVAVVEETEEPVTNEEEAVEETAVEPVEPVAEEPADEAPDLAGLVKQAVAEAFAPFQPLLNELQTNANRERVDLIGALTANERCAFDADDLKGMEINQLRKLARSLNVPAPDYSGRGSGMETNGRDDDGEPQIYQMPSVFNRKGKE